MLERGEKILCREMATEFFMCTSLSSIPVQLHCSPGQTVKQVIDSGIPSISKAGYQVFQYPARALLNPQKEASILRDQEIWIEPVQPRIGMAGYA